MVPTVTVTLPRGGHSTSTLHDTLSMSLLPTNGDIPCPFARLFSQQISASSTLFMHLFINSLGTDLLHNSEVCSVVSQSGGFLRPVVYLACDHSKKARSLLASCIIRFFFSFFLLALFSFSSHFLWDCCFLSFGLFGEGSLDYHQIFSVKTAGSSLTLHNWGVCTPASSHREGISTTARFCFVGWYLSGLPVAEL